MIRPVQNELWQAQGGREITGSWKEVDFVQDETESDFIPADCLTMNTGTDGMLINNHAREILEPILTGTGRFWPASVMGHQYWWHNCTALVDALDPNNTDADWSSVEGRWGSLKWITKARSLAFRQSRIKRAPVLFRIPEFPQGMLFARDALRNAVRDYRLIGFRFDLVWSAEIGGVLDPHGIEFGGIFKPVSTDSRKVKRQAARELLANRRQKLGAY